MLDKILQDKFKNDLVHKDYYLSVKLKDSYVNDYKLPFFEKIKIALHPFKNPYSPFIYPIRKKVEYYYNEALFKNKNITNGFKEFYLSKINLKNKNIKILDFGCGQGRSIAIMNNLGFNNIVGQDILNFNYWKRLKATFIKIPIGYDNFYPYKNNSFDMVFCFQVHMYLNEALLKEHIENIARILTDEGYYIFEDRNENMLNPSFYTSNKSCPYIHKSSMVKDLLEKNKLKVIEEKTYGIGVKKLSVFFGVIRSLLTNKNEFDIFDYKAKSLFDRFLKRFVPLGKENLHLIVCKKIGNQD